MDTIGSRIRQARNRKGLSQPQLAKLAGVSKGTVSMWETGVTKPKGENLMRLSSVLGMSPLSLVDGPSDDVKDVAPPDYIPVRKVPLIAWVAAGNWCDSPDNHQPGDAEEWLDCPFPFSDSAFCLAVVGDSMWPEYREGEYILVDPALDAVHGDDVVAREPDGKHTFKRLQITPEGTYLLALNPDHPNRKIEIPPDTRICGVVTGSWMRRRKK